MNRPLQQSESVRSAAVTDSSEDERVPERSWIVTFMVDLRDYAWNELTKLYSWYKSFLFSFIGAHYIFIVSWSILLSIILYPYKNMSYTDALFHGVSFGTSTGLSTFAGNEFALYQQIFSYVFCTLAQPLIVNSSMVLLRLYLYEKRFQGINSRAKEQSKLRRYATKAAASMRHGSHNDPRQTTMVEDPEKSGNISGKAEGVMNSSGDVVASSSDQSTKSRAGRDNDMEAIVPFTTANENDELERTGDGSGTDAPGSPNIMFADLPHPPHKDTRGYNAQEMFRSLNMLRNQQHNDDIDEDDGPALVVKSPRDIEADAARGINSVFVQGNRVGIERRLSGAGGDFPGTEHGPALRHADTTATMFSEARSNSRSRRRQSMSANYLSWNPTVGKNSTFVGLTRDQKAELGGVEYRALKVLLWFIYGYHFGLLVLGAVIMVPWCVERKDYASKFYSQGYTPTWFGIFTGMSSFHNLGFSLSPDSMTLFQKSSYIPLFSAFFILAGDLLLPVLLRLMIWVAFVVTPPYGQMHESIGFLLDHPRRCFLLLFPSKATWLLGLVVVILNVVDFCLFLILDINAESLKDIPANYRAMGGFFQGVASRKAGFNIFILRSLHPAILLVYVFMMYISVFPLAISIRKTNVYEDQTLGIYYEQSEDGEAIHKDSNPVGTHMQRQLSHDMWYLTLGLLLLCICQGHNIKTGEMTIFDLLFEAVSGYTNTGLSLSDPSSPVSLSGQFNVPGKLVIMALMIRGRHRGLPYRVDRAIILRGENVERRDTFQQSMTRDAQPMALRTKEPESLWMTRVGTAASKLHNSATMRLRPAFSRMSARTTTHRGTTPEAREHEDVQPVRSRAFSFELGKLRHT